MSTVTVESEWCKKQNQNENVNVAKSRGTTTTSGIVEPSYVQRAGEASVKAE